MTPSPRLQATGPLSHATCPRFPLTPCLHHLVVRPVYSPLATSDRHWIDVFPLAAKLTWPSHPKTIGPGSSIAPVASADIKTQDTAALRSTRRASPLPIAPRGRDLVSVSKDCSWIWYRSGPFVRFCYSSFVLDVPLSIFSFPIRFRLHHRARCLVSHPPTSARSPPRSRTPFNKISRVRTSRTTPRGLSPVASVSSS